MEYVQKLIAAAIKARDNAYCPYSKFAVGAALITERGKIYTGCNIENVTYGLCVCGERTAFLKAVSEGEKKFKALAVVSGKVGSPPSGFAFSCGICRQVFAEFCDKDFLLIVAESEKRYKTSTLGELFPNAFSPRDIDFSTKV